MPRASGKRKRREANDDTEPQPPRRDVKPVAELPCSSVPAPTRSSISPATENGVYEHSPIPLRREIGKLLDCQSESGQLSYQVRFKDSTANKIDRRDIINPTDEKMFVRVLPSGSQVEQQWKIQKMLPAQLDRRPRAVVVTWARDWISQDELRAQSNHEALLRMLDECEPSKYSMKRSRIAECSAKKFIKAKSGQDHYHLIKKVQSSVRRSSPWVKRLMDLPALRAVLLRGAYFDKPDLSRRFALHNQDRRNAVLVQATGIQHPGDSQCRPCRDGRGPFHGCVTSPPGSHMWFNGACACCQYAQQPKKCTHHKRNAPGESIAVTSVRSGRRRQRPSFIADDNDSNASFRPSPNGNPSPPPSPCPSQPVTRSGGRARAEGSRSAVRARERRKTNANVIIPPLPPLTPPPQLEEGNNGAAVSIETVFHPANQPSSQRTAVARPSSSLFVSPDVPRANRLNDDTARMSTQAARQEVSTPETRSRGGNTLGTPSTTFQPGSHTSIELGGYVDSASNDELYVSSVPPNPPTLRPPVFTAINAGITAGVRHSTPRRRSLMDLDDPWADQTISARKRHADSPYARRQASTSISLTQQRTPRLDGACDTPFFRSNRSPVDDFHMSW